MTSYQKLGCYSSVIFAKCRLIFYVNGKSPDPKKTQKAPKPQAINPSTKNQIQDPNPKIPTP